MAPDEQADSHDHENPEQGDHYRHRDGTDEIVFAVENGRVLTVREYRRVEDFAGAVSDAEYAGSHEGVADLPGVETFGGEE
jgi:hypothetical protein